MIQGVSDASLWAINKAIYCLKLLFRELEVTLGFSIISLDKIYLNIIEAIYDKTTANM